MPYLINDVAALAYVWIKYVESMETITKTPRGFILSQLTQASLAWRTFMSRVPKKDLPSQYLDKVARKFVRKAIHGGRCVPYIRKYENKDDPILAADENSLYTGAMIRIKKYPDIRKSRLLRT